MADGIYVGMAGAAARMTELDSIADNLANAQTAGYKAERPAFESFLPTGETGGPSFPAAVTTALDLRDGAHKVTGQPLDVVPEDGAFLQVSLGNEQVGYTRNGQLSIGGDSLLSAAGHPVLDLQGQPIQLPPGEKVDLTADGAVTVHGTRLAQLATYKLSGPIDRVSPTVLAPGEGGMAVPASGRVRLGELELSNTTEIESMIHLIDAQRQYDSSMQAIQTYKTMSSKDSQLGTVQG